MTLWEKIKQFFRESFEAMEDAAEYTDAWLHGDDDLD